MESTQKWRKPKRRRWREADARVVVEAWRNSGDSLSAFCRDHKLTAQRVARWARRLAGDSIQFHPVELVRGAGPASAASLEVELARGETIRVPTGFALDDLRRVLMALDERT